MKRTALMDGWQVAQDGAPARAVSLPHDAMLELGREANAPSGGGGAFFRGGRFTYERTLAFSAAALQQRYTLELEGVSPRAEVFLNGARLGACSYGYGGYCFALDGLTAENTLRVVADGRGQPGSRWYAGVGIYRPVWLWSGGAAHIEPHGVFLKTEGLSPARVSVRVRFTGEGCTVRNTFLFRGQPVCAQEGGAEMTLTVPDARLWDAEHPNLYECRTELLQNGQVVDEQTEPFGIRTLSWSTAGFFVNGKETLLRGGCLHHDNGVIGARTFAESELRRVKRLKDCGFNAIRSAHNPAGRWLLEACDRLGVYVMDECWDMWDKPKTKYDYAASFPANWWQDIRALTEKDYNHPCVVLYSIGNEVTEPAQAQGVQRARELVDYMHLCDASRPVTAGINITLLFLASMGIDLTTGGGGGQPQTEMNSTEYNRMVQESGERMNQAAALDQADAVSSPVLDLLDIAGYNYASARYAMEGEKHPGRILVGTETYPHKLYENWAMVQRYPYLIGDFMWTAWDYLGEVGIGAWTWEADSDVFQKQYPWLLADAGAFDLLGNETGEAGETSVIWGARKLWLGVMPPNHAGQTLKKAIWRGSNALPAWSFRGCDGNPAEVEVYAAGAEAELFRNGTSLGRRALCAGKAVFETVYEPGELRAVTYDDAGNPLAETALRSATGDLSIRITPEPKYTEDDLYYVAIDLVGENGEIECNRDTRLTVRVTGGELVGFGSANPRTPERFPDGVYSTWYGRSQAVVRKTGEALHLTVCGAGLPDASCTL